MVDFNSLYTLQQQLANPMLNIQMAQAQAARPLGAPSPPQDDVAATTLLVNQLNRIPEMRIAEQQRAIENERARQIADLQMQQFQAKLNKPAQMGNTPLWFRDPETGELKIGRFGPEGVVIQDTGGLEPVRPVTTFSAGGTQAIMPYGAEQPSGYVEKTLPPEARPETRAAQTVAVEQAKSRTQAQAALPGATAKAEEVNRLIDEMLVHPGLEAGTGKSAMWPVFPGTDRMDFERRRAQLAGGVFIQALREMKEGGGVGQITEIEGEKAESAIARMEAAVKKEDFIEALEDYRSVVNAALKRQQEQAGTTEETPNVVDWSEL